MKRSLHIISGVPILILSIAVLLSLFSFSVSAAEFLRGDLNNDGMVDITDASLLLQNSLFPEIYPVSYPESLDFNHDGICDIRDAVRLIQYSLYPEIYPITAHTMEHVDEKAASCTVSGTIEYWYCPECDRYFADADGMTVIAYEDTVIPALGHIPVSDEALEPTYELTGLTEGSHCARCQEILEAQNVIPALDYENVSIAPLTVYGITAEAEPIIPLGTPISVTVNANRPNDELALALQVFNNGECVDLVSGSGVFSYTPKESGTYSMKLTVTDQDGRGSAYTEYLTDITTVVPDWDLVSLTTNKSAYTSQDRVHLTSVADGKNATMQGVYRVYKDGSLYHEKESNDDTYEFTVPTAGTYFCTYTVTDHFGTEKTITSDQFVVSESDGYAVLLDTPTHSGLLPLDEVRDLDTQDIRLADVDTLFTWDRLPTDAYYLLTIKSSENDTELKQYTGNSYSMSASRLYPGKTYNVRLKRYNAADEITDTISFRFIVVGKSTIYEEETIKLLQPTELSNIDSQQDLTVVWTESRNAKSVVGGITLELTYSCGLSRHTLLKKSLSGQTHSYTIPSDKLISKQMLELKITKTDTYGNDVSERFRFYVDCTKNEAEKISSASIAFTSPVMSEDKWDLLEPESYDYPYVLPYEPITFSWNPIPGAAYYLLNIKAYNESTDDSSKPSTISNVAYKGTDTVCTIDPSRYTGGKLYVALLTVYHDDECYSSIKTYFWMPQKSGKALTPPVVTLSCLSEPLSHDSAEPTVFPQQDIVVSWDAISAATDYYVHLYLKEDSDFVLYKNKSTTKTSFSVSRSTLTDYTDETLVLELCANDSSHNTYIVSYFYLKPVGSQLGAAELVSPRLSQTESNPTVFKDPDDICLRWEEMEGAAFYRVRLSDQYDGEKDLIVKHDVYDQTSFTLTDDDLYENGFFYLDLIPYDQYGNPGRPTHYYFCIGSKRSINVNKKTLDISEYGDDVWLEITTMGQWSVSTMEPWISFDRYSGNGTGPLKVLIAKNTDSFPRTGDIRITSGTGKTVTVSVEQAAGSASNSGTLRITSPMQGATVSLCETINAAWTYAPFAAYFNIAVYDNETDECVYEHDTVITHRDSFDTDILSEGCIYRFTVTAYDASKTAVTSSSVVFRTDGERKSDLNIPKPEKQPTQEAPETVPSITSEIKLTDAHTVELKGHAAGCNENEIDKYGFHLWNENAVYISTISNPNEFSAVFTGLTPGVRYYYSAFVSCHGTLYGVENLVPFTLQEEQGCDHTYMSSDLDGGGTFAICRNCGDVQYVNDSEAAWRGYLQSETRQKVYDNAALTVYDGHSCIFAADTIRVLASSGSAYLVEYPVSGGSKMRFIAKRYVQDTPYAAEEKPEDTDAEEPIKNTGVSPKNAVTKLRNLYLNETSNFSAMKDTAIDEFDAYYSHVFPTYASLIVSESGNLYDTLCMAASIIMTGDTQLQNAKAAITRMLDSMNDEYYSQKAKEGFGFIECLIRFFGTATQEEIETIFQEVKDIEEVLDQLTNVKNAIADGVKEPVAEFLDNLLELAERNAALKKALASIYSLNDNVSIQKALDAVSSATGRLKNTVKSILDSKVLKGVLIGKHVLWDPLFVDYATKLQELNIIIDALEAYNQDTPILTAAYQMRDEMNYAYRSAIAMIKDGIDLVLDNLPSFSLMTLGFRLTVQDTAEAVQDFVFIRAIDDALAGYAEQLANEYEDNGLSGTWNEIEKVLHALTDCRALMNDMAITINRVKLMDFIDVWKDDITTTLEVYKYIYQNKHEAIRAFINENAE